MPFNLQAGAEYHYYTNFTGGGRFWFPAVGKAVHRGLEATVNRGLTAADGFARCGRPGRKEGQLGHCVGSYGVYVQKSKPWASVQCRMPIPVVASSL